MTIADLHTHTTFSDGRLSPAGLVEKAALRGLAALAITDHDSVGGLQIAEQAARHHGIRLVSGVELSGHYSGIEVHLLGYGFDPRSRTLRRHLAVYQDARYERARSMVSRLRQLGAPVSWERLQRIAGAGTIGRPHVARALVEAGHVDRMGDAFEKYLGNEAPAYVPMPHVAVEDLISLIHESGGVAVIAHPGTTVAECDVAHLAEAGLGGIETTHPAHDVHLTAHWERVAKRLGLAASGGSDFHGYRWRDEENFGRLGMPALLVDALLERTRGSERREPGVTRGG